MQDSVVTALWKKKERSTYSYREATVNIPLGIQWCLIIKVKQINKRMCDESLSQELWVPEFGFQEPMGKPGAGRRRQRQADPRVVP